MKQTLSLLFLVAILLAAPSKAQTLLMPGDYPDPSILRDGEDYYMTHSPVFYHRGFLIWHSRDLFNWEPLCRVNLGQDDSVWAPDLVKYGDTYYIYYPTADGRIFVITASDICGPWSEPVQIHIGFLGIDPGHIADRDGRRYLFTSGGMMTPLTPDGLAVAGPSTCVYQGWDIPEDWIVEGKHLESPKLTYHDGYYYMTSAQGGTGGPATSHMAIQARAKDLMGPWENSPYNPLVHTYSATEKWWSKGHGTMVCDTDGRWFMVYHAYPNSGHTLGRATLIEEFEKTADGWFMPMSESRLQEPKPRNWLSDDFKGDSLSLQWAFWKEDATPHIKLKGSTLRVEAKGTTPADARLLILTPEHRSYEVSVEVSLKTAEAGLLLYYNEDNFAGIVASKTSLRIYRDGKTYETTANPFGRKARLKIINQSDRLTFQISANGKKWRTVASCVDVSQMHHNTLGGFISLRVALLASGQGQAEFKNFKYKTVK